MVFFPKMLANFVPTLCLGLSSSGRDLKFGTKLRDLRVVPNYVSSTLAAIWDSAGKIWDSCPNTVPNRR